MNHVHHASLPDRSAQHACIEPLERRTLMAFGLLGPEFPVNTTTTGDQTAPAVAADADGDFVIAWASSGQDGSGMGVYAQHYSAAGEPLGGEFLVTTKTAGDQSDPAVAMDADGDFVITWTGQDGSGTGVYAQRYTAAGVPLGDEFLVNTTTTMNQTDVAVAMEADGDFVVAWGGGGQVFVRRFSAAGDPLGDEFLVSDSIGAFHMNPSVAMDADGDFVVAWDAYVSFGAVTAPAASDHVYARRYDAAGRTVGTEFCVKAAASDYQARPSVAMDADGDFVIAWANSWYGWYGGQWVHSDIEARRYNAAGVPEDAGILVTSYLNAFEASPSVAMDADGDFAIAWESSSYYDQSGLNIHVLRFDAAGVSHGDEFRVNTTTDGWQQFPSIAMADHGDFVIAWTDFGGGTGDVYAQRFGEDGIPPPPLLPPPIWVPPPIYEIPPPPLPVMIVGDAAITEGDAGTVNALFTVSLSATSQQTVTVDYFTSDDSARAGHDYSAVSGTLTFAPGETAKTIALFVRGDHTDEDDEQFALNLVRAAGADIGDGQGIGTILDDDPPPSIVINNVSIGEGSKGSAWLTFDVILSVASEKEIRVNFATASGTASAGSDYATSSGTLTFTPGVVRRTITIQVFGDIRRESNETFLVNLTSPLNGTLADALGIGTILNDDWR